MKLECFLAFLAVILTTGVIQSQECQPSGEFNSLTLDESEGIALENNYTIQSLLHQTLQGYYGHNATVGRWLPQITGNINSKRTAIGPAPLGYGTFNESILTFFQNILNTDDYFNVKAADLLYQRLRAEALLQACDVLLNVRIGYFFIIFWRTAVKVQEENVSLLEREWIREKARFEAGEGIRYKVNQSEAALENARTAQYQAERQLQIAIYDFLAQLALPPSTKFNLSLNEIPVEQIPEINDRVRLIEQNTSSSNLFSQNEINEWEKMAVFFKPEIQIARLNIWIGRVNLNKQEGQYLPTVNLFADYFNNGGKFLPPKSYWDMGVNVNWTLFDGFTRENRVYGAREGVLAAEEDYYESILTAEVIINDRLADFKEALQSYRSSKRAVAVAEEAVAMLQTEETVGKATFLDYLDSVQALTNARLNLNQAKFNLIASYFGLLRATGRDVWLLKLALDQTGGFCDFVTFSSHFKGNNPSVSSPR